MEQHNPNPMVQQNLNNAPPAPQETNTPLPLEEPKVKKRNFVLIGIVTFLFLIIPSLLTYYFLTRNTDVVEEGVNKNSEVAIEIEKEENIVLETLVSKKLANLSEEFLRMESILEPSPVTHSSDSIVISPDKTRIAYPVLNEDRSGYVMLNNEKGEKYDFIGSDIIFSQDGEQFLYVAGLKDKRFIVLNGIPQKKYDGTVLNPTFSPDGKQLAYRVKQEDEQFIVLNGEKKEPYTIIPEGMQRDYDPEITFSPDGKNFAYRATKEGQQFVILNETKQSLYKYAKNLVFSPNSNKLAYIASRDESYRKKFVVLNEEELKEYEIISYLTFSPDSQKLAYRALEVQEEEQFMVINEVEQKHYDGIQSSIVFSPDSKRFVYSAGSENTEYSFAVLNNIEKHNFPFPRSFTFSPDSKSLAYVYIGGIVLNNELYHTNIRERDRSYNLVFSPNNQSLAFYVRDAWETNSYYVFLDNKIFGPYKFLYTETLQFDLEGEVLKYVARIDNEIWLKVIDVETKQKLF